MTIDLTDKTVLVTGASRGIGRALAQGLAAAGATVAVHYNKNSAAAEELAAALGSGARTFAADLRHSSEVESLFARVVEVYTQLDILISNAGLAHLVPLHAPVDVWERAWDETMAVNLKAAELLNRLAVRHFLTRGTGGRIINIASRAAFRGDTPEYLAYAASKGGVVALTRSIARAYGKSGICAFVIAPGFVRTDMAQESIDEYGEEFVLNNIALPRLTEPEDLAPIVTLLAGGYADHATGTTIDINAASYVH